MFTKFSLKDYNFKLLSLVVIAICFGTVLINSADSSFTMRQIIGGVFAIAVILVVSVINYDFICKFYTLIFMGNLVLLALVLLFGVEVNSAKRWIVVGGENGIQFQPSEFAKLFMIIFISVMLGRFRDDDKINSFRCLASFAIASGVCLLFIVIEPDLSTTVCLTLILITMLYVAGLSYKIIGLMLLFLIPTAGSFLWYIQRPDQVLLKDYQVARIMQFIYPSQYGQDYSQQNNSIMAIGSGKLTGKGLNTSTIATVKDANFISEQQTDFIFSVIGEELGFIGSVILIAILFLIVLQCLKIARSAKDSKGMLIATGVGCIIGYQSFINIGVATGVLPNTGIPLPFISYGLSSLVSLSAGIGIVLNISIQRRKY
ncbi:MAG: FtsW/RodA/SpoVE family cell cycle protein [Lachnospiraceae bacterium]|nr:FtsW/RodA/SpoVE family cell cycle protein [Lachnospiraceae bacterium]